MKKIFKTEKGQVLIEYVIVTAMVGILCLTLMRKIGGTLNKKMKSIENRINNMEIR